MRKIKFVLISAALFSLLFSPLFAPAQVNYATRAWNFISQAAALGPPAGLNKLIGGNANKDARGCAVQLAKRNPDRAANIMIAVCQRLIIFGNTTRQTRAYQNPKDPVQPFRYQYWQEAVTQSNLASNYIKQTSKTNPQQASQLAIRLATLFYNNIPGNKNYAAYRSTFRQKAKWYLYSSNSESARYYANKIMNKKQRQTVLNQIQGLRKAWKL
ncbi:MAG: hypothetical protein JW747_03905 [Candidatus Aminicenantes bacterium]|nr:hypothetical protein [Candidatus Aminicenantes bacterium]